jgi:hypothetical protein
MEFNTNDMSLNGKPKGKNIFITDAKDIKAATSTDKLILSKFNEEMMKQEMNVEDDLTITRNKREIKEYNQSLRTIEDDVKNIVLNGNQLLIRLFKHNPYIESGMLTTKKPIMTRYTDKESGRMKEDEAFLQFISRGVIVNMTGKYSDQFKENFKVGDVVDLKFGVALDQQICFLDTQEFYHQGLYAFKNYFNINENMIEKKHINYEI